MFQANPDIPLPLGNEKNKKIPNSSLTQKHLMSIYYD